MITVRTYATAGTLNQQVEFDSPFTVLPADEDGNVEITDGPAGVYAPELYDVTTPDTFHDGEWDLVTGYSGQHGYSGPIMHDSEYLGGGMARDVLATPGTYVVVAAYYSPEDVCTICREDVTTDDAGNVVHVDETDDLHTASPDDESTIEGWALARLRD